MGTQTRNLIERVHVAVLLPEYVDLIVSGEKTIESRLSLTRRSPFGRVRAGERVYIKERGGDVRVCVTVDQVRSFEGLTPAELGRIQRRYNDKIHGSRASWHARREARYATLLWLTDVQPVRFGPSVPPFYGSAWVSLPAARCVFPECLASAA